MTGCTYLQWPSRQALLSEPLIFLMNRMALIPKERLDRVRFLGVWDGECCYCWVSESQISRIKMDYADLRVLDRVRDLVWKWGGFCEGPGSE